MSVTTQLHIQEAELIERYAADFAAEVCAQGMYCPTVEEAKGILTAEALARVDSDFAQGASIASSFGPQMPYEFAGAFLDKLAKANDSGTGQPYFSATAQDYGNHQLNAQYLVENKGLYDLATAYGGTALRGYGDAFVLALAGQNDVRGGASAQDLATLRADLAALPEAELQALATQIAVEMATAGVAIPAADLLLDSTGVTTEDFSNEMLQVGVASLELGQEMLAEIEAKFRAGEPLTDDERWLVMMTSAGGFAATGGAAMLSWVKTMKLPRFRRLVAERVGYRTVANSDDIAEIRTRLGLDDANTVGAARTDIPGLEGNTFEGVSPKLRKDAGLPSLDDLYGTNRPIQSPRTNALFTRHAEEDIFNGIARQIDDSGLTAVQLNGRTVNIHISNQSGVCTACYQGLTNPSVPAGVVKQFSDRYPSVTVRITSDGGVARPGVQELVVRGGAIVE